MKSPQDACCFISRDDSLIIKGVAILFMILHHAFGFPKAVPEGQPMHGWLMNGGHFFSECCLYLHACVPMFLFVTGLGMGVNALDSRGGVFSSLFRKIKHSVLKFYEIYAFSFLSACLLLYFVPQDWLHIDWSLKTLAEVFLGISPGLFCPEWWYASLFLFCVLLVYPVTRLMAIFLASSKLGAGAGTALAAAVLSAFSLRLGWTEGLGNLLFLSIVFVIGFFIGLNNENAFLGLLGRWAALKRSSFLVRAGGAVFLLGLLLLCCYGSRDCFRFLMICFFTIAIAPLVVRGSLSGIFKILGKYSGLMWLNHTFFLYFYLRYWIYSFDSVWIIFFSVTLLSFLTAFISMKIIEGIRFVAGKYAGEKTVPSSLPPDSSVGR